MVIALKGNRITLRTLIPKDAVAISKYANDKDIARHTTLPYPYKLSMAQEFIRKTRNEQRNKKGYELGIQLHATGEIIGMMSLMNVRWNNKNAEIGYWLGKQYWKQHLGTEAIRLILRFGFTTLNLEKIYATVDHPNIASQKLLLKNGFKLEGRLRKQRFRNKEWYDELRFGLLREEYGR